jgi:hypothetical protein
MKSLLALPAVLAIAGIALAQPASATMIRTAAPPAIVYAATSLTVQTQTQSAMPWGRRSDIPPFFDNGSYRPGYGLFVGGN